MALTFVQSGVDSGGSGNHPSLTLVSTPAAGNLIVVTFFINDRNGGIDISNVSGGYTLIPGHGDVGFNNQLHMWSYYKIAGVGESKTISADIDDVRGWVVAASEYHDSAVGASWVFDKAAENQGTSTNGDSGTTATTSQVSEVWYAAIGNVNNSAQSLPTNSFIQDATQSSGGASNSTVTGGIYHRIAAGTGTANTTVSIAGSHPWAGMVATFYTVVVTPPTINPSRTRGAIARRLTQVRRLPHSELSPPTVVTIIPPPANTVAPVASGTTIVGQTLSVTDGSWTGTPTSFTYQWARDNQGVGGYTNIPGGTANTYLLVDADDICHLRCTVTAYNARGSATSTSNILGPVVEPLPVNTVAPTVSGSPQVGGAVSATQGTWTHMSGYNPTYTYQWQRSPDGLGSWVDISAAGNFSFYWPTTADVGKYLRFFVVAHNSGGSSSASYTLGVGPVGTLGAAVAVANVLGCGTYEVVVLTRGGRALVSVLEWTQVSWSRVLDETSEATITGSTGQDARCCEALNEIKPWRHEIGILRDSVLIWVGPIIQVQTPPGTFQITARDISAWWDHRLIHNSYNFVQEDMGTIFQAFSDDAMAPDPSPGMILNVTFSGVRATKRVLSTQHQIAGPVLRDLCNTGIDWTAIGRTILAGGLVVPTQAIGAFTDSHFATPPTPTFSGEQQSNSPTVRGAGGGTSGDRIYAKVDDFRAILQDGLLESVETISSITDHNSALQASESQLALRKTVAQVEACELIPEAPFTLDTLIPGALCRLDLQETCIPVSGVFRLKSVQGTVNANSNDTITLVFQPEGTTRAEGAPATS